MAKAQSPPVPYVLIGARHKHTGVFFGFNFRDGRCDVPAEAHLSCGHVLREHYSAMPLDEAVREKIVDSEGNLVPSDADKADKADKRKKAGEDK